MSQSFLASTSERPIKIRLMRCISLWEASQSVLFPKKSHQNTRFCQIWSNIKMTLWCLFIKSFESHQPVFLDIIAHPQTVVEVLEFHSEKCCRYNADQQLQFNLFLSPLSLGFASFRIKLRCTCCSMATTFTFQVSRWSFLVWDLRTRFGTYTPK